MTTRRHILLAAAATIAAPWVHAQPSGDTFPRRPITLWVPWPAGGLQAPHINISIFARGVLNRLATRLYFDGDPALGEDPVLKLVEPARRDTLIAKRDDKGAWRLPIHLGGPNETVFFDV